MDTNNEQNNLNFLIILFKLRSYLKQTQINRGLWPKYYS